ncbi:MAG: hypothetical protein ACYCYO_15650 [Bacilli bacterium]
MRRFTPSILTVAIVGITVLFPSIEEPWSAQARELPQPHFAPAKDSSAPQSVAHSVQTTIEFRTANPWLKRVTGARIVVIDRSGAILATGLTDSAGLWTATISTAPDPRFVRSDNLGTVTALVTATGYNEALLFEVPAVQGQVQPVILNPIQQGQRNEPTVALGNIHRHSYMRLIDDYAQRAKLVRQPVIRGEQGYAPWDFQSR